MIKVHTMLAAAALVAMTTSAMAAPQADEPLMGLGCHGTDPSATGNDVKAIDVNIVVMKTKPMSAFIAFSETHIGQANLVEWHNAKDGGVLKLGYDWTAFHADILTAVPTGDFAIFIGNTAKRTRSKLTGHCTIIDGDDLKKNANH